MELFQYVETRIKLEKANSVKEIGDFFKIQLSDDQKIHAPPVKDHVRKNRIMPGSR